MKLALIDRDGVLCEERPGYVTSAEQLILLPGAAPALALLARAGYQSVLVTNQSVVGRGLIDETALARIHEALFERLAALGGALADLFVCTDAPDQATYRRKPKPGMLLEALEKYGATPSETPFIGDAVTDMQAAYAAGCRRYLTLTGKGRTHRDRLKGLEPVTVCNDVLDAARRIVGGG